jgi:hypothetical protein
VAVDRPLARGAGLLTEEVDGELIVYDEHDQVACRLNHVAALVWRSSDGTRTIDELVAVVAQELGDVADEDLVRIALDQLAEHDLIESGYEQRDADEARFSRRRFFRRVGVVGAAAAALPIVTSMVVPAAAAAQSSYYGGIYGGQPLVSDRRLKLNVATLRGAS